MKRRSGLLAPIGVAIAATLACVTINVYFPEAAIKDLSKQIEDQVQKEAAKQQPPAEPPAPSPSDKPKGGSASLLDLVLGATPALAVSPVAAWMRSFRRRATVRPSGSPHAFSVTSRKASSSESGSTRAVASLKMANTWSDTERYFSKSGLTTTSSRQSRRARVMGIAERTPNFRAS